MTLLPLSRDSRRDTLNVTPIKTRARFSNLLMRHPLKPECELNHALRLPTLVVTKSNAKRVKRTLRRNDCIVSM